MNDTFLMWVEDGVIEFDYYAKNSYEYPRLYNENMNTTIYALHDGMFRAGIQGPPGPGTDQSEPARDFQKLSGFGPWIPGLE